MAKDMGVAVGTLRKALAILENKGLLQRIQGSGNYVRSKHNIDSIYSFFRLELVSGGGLPSAETISISLDKKEDIFPNFGEAIEAFKIIRVRFLDKAQVAMEEIWLDRRFTDGPSLPDLSESLYHYYKDSLQLVISRIEDKVSYSPLPSWAPKTFHMRKGEMAGYIERVSWDQFNQPAEFSRTWFDPRLCLYVNRI